VATHWYIVGDLLLQWFGDLTDDIDIVFDTLFIYYIVTIAITPIHPFYIYCDFVDDYRWCCWWFCLLICWHCFGGVRLRLFRLLICCLIYRCLITIPVVGSLLRCCYVCWLRYCVTVDLLRLPLSWLLLLFYCCCSHFRLIWLLIVPLRYCWFGDDCWLIAFHCWHWWLRLTFPCCPRYCTLLITFVGVWWFVPLIDYVDQGVGDCSRCWLLYVIIVITFPIVVICWRSFQFCCCCVVTVTVGYLRLRCFLMLIRWLFGVAFVAGWFVVGLFPLLLIAGCPRCWLVDFGLRCDLPVCYRSCFCWLLLDCSVPVDLFVGWLRFTVIVDLLLLLLFDWVILICVVDYVVCWLLLLLLVIVVIYCCYCSLLFGVLRWYLGVYWLLLLNDCCCCLLLYDLFGCCCWCNLLFLCCWLLIVICSRWLWYSDLLIIVVLDCTIWWFIEPQSCRCCIVNSHLVLLVGSRCDLCCPLLTCWTLLLGCCWCYLLLLYCLRDTIYCWLLIPRYVPVFGYGCWLRCWLRFVGFGYVRYGLLLLFTDWLLLLIVDCWLVGCWLWLLLIGVRCCLLFDCCCCDCCWWLLIDWWLLLITLLLLFPFVCVLFTLWTLCAVCCCCGPGCYWFWPHLLPRPVIATVRCCLLLRFARCGCCGRFTRTHHTHLVVHSTCARGAYLYCCCYVLPLPLPLVCCGCCYLLLFDLLLLLFVIDCAPPFIDCIICYCIWLLIVGWTLLLIVYCCCCCCCWVCGCCYLVLLLFWFCYCAVVVTQLVSVYSWFLFDLLYLVNTVDCCFDCCLIWPTHLLLLFCCWLIRCSYLIPWWPIDCCDLFTPRFTLPDPDLLGGHLCWSWRCYPLLLLGGIWTVVVDLLIWSVDSVVICYWWSVICYWFGDLRGWFDWRYHVVVDCLIYICVVIVITLIVTLLLVFVVIPIVRCCWLRLLIVCCCWLLTTFHLGVTVGSYPFVVDLDFDCAVTILRLRYVVVIVGWLYRLLLLFWLNPVSCWCWFGCCCSVVVDFSFYCCCCWLLLVDCYICCYWLVVVIVDCWLLFGWLLIGYCCYIVVIVDGCCYLLIPRRFVLLIVDCWLTFVVVVDYGDCCWWSLLLRLLYVVLLFDCCCWFVIVVGVVVIPLFVVVVVGCWTLHCCWFNCDLLWNVVDLLIVTFRCCCWCRLLVMLLRFVVVGVVVVIVGWVVVIDLLLLCFCYCCWCCYCWFWTLVVITRLLLLIVCWLFDPMLFLFILIVCWWLFDCCWCLQYLLTHCYLLLLLYCDIMSSHLFCWLLLFWFIVVVVVDLFYFGLGDCWLLFITVIDCCCLILIVVVVTLLLIVPHVIVVDLLIYSCCYPILLIGVDCLLLLFCLIVILLFTFVLAMVGWLLTVVVVVVIVHFACLCCGYALLLLVEFVVVDWLLIVVVVVVDSLLLLLLLLLLRWHCWFIVIRYIDLIIVVVITFDCLDYYR